METMDDDDEEEEGEEATRKTTTMRSWRCVMILSHAFERTERW